MLVIALSFCNIKFSIPTSSLSLNAVLKGVFDFPKVSTGNRYYLIELKIKNTSTTQIEFLTHSCTPGENLVFDSSNIIPVINTCVSNRLRPVILKPNQEFSVVSIITSSSSFPEALKVGWIFLNRENTKSSDEYFNTLFKSREKGENILWSSPLKLGDWGGEPYEIR